MDDTVQSGGGDWAEDLAALAALEFEKAQTDCVSCHDYHALWGYLRVTGITGNSFQSDRDLLQPLLGDNTPPGGRILIAGAADAGLLALTASATHMRGPAITVADRCATPLAICRRYAESHGLHIETVRTDLTAEPLASKQDLAFAHNVLMLMPLERHAAFLGHLRRALEPDGALVLLNRERPQGWVSHPPEPERYAARVLAALAERGIAPPESEAAFRHRLETFSVAQHLWSDAIVDLAHVEACLAEAGFEISDRIAHDRRRTAPDRDGGPPKPMRTHIFVARPRKGR